MTKRDGSLAGYVWIDKADQEWAAQYNWVMRPDGYIIRRNGTSTTRMHREMMGLQPGDPREVDHKNRKPWDNRRSNLRICLHRENRQNNGPGKMNKSGILGVGWDEKRKKWRAQQTFDGKNYFLGRYKRKIDAVRAVRNFRREHMPFSEEAA